MQREKHIKKMQGNPIGKRIKCPLCDNFTHRSKSDTTSFSLHCDICNQQFYIRPIINEYEIVWFTYESQKT